MSLFVEGLRGCGGAASSAPTVLAGGVLAGAMAHDENGARRGYLCEKNIGEATIG
jgi:hypothetical protein